MENMTNLAYTQEELKEQKKPYEKRELDDQDKYPYGLTLELRDEVLKKMGIKSAADLPEAGTKIEITAHAKIKEVRVNDKAPDKKQLTVELQICELSLGDEVSGESKMDQDVKKAEEDVKDYV